MSGLEARIAEVIAGNDRAHAFRMADYSDNERPMYRCACGLEAIGMHHEHHRKALTAALLPMTRAAQAEALRDAADGFRNCPDWGFRATRPMATEDYLRARADNLEAS